MTVDWPALVVAAGGGGVLVKVLGLVFKNRRQTTQDVAGGWKDIAHDCGKRLDRTEKRLDDCEEKHAKSEVTCARLEERLSLLEARSDPPPAAE